MPHHFGRRDSRARDGTEDRLFGSIDSAPGRRALLLLAPCGCGGLRVREPVLRNAIVDRMERQQATNQLSGASGAVLQRYDLVKTAAGNPAGAARALEKKLEVEPVHDGALALAELSYQAGLLERSRAAKSKAAWYRDAAVLAALALEEPGGSRPDLAIQIHNGAVSRLIRASQAEATAGRTKLAGCPGRAGDRAFRDRGLLESAADRRPAGRGRPASEGDGPHLSTNRVWECRWWPTAWCRVDPNTPEVQDVAG